MANSYPIYCKYMSAGSVWKFKLGATGSWASNVMYLQTAGWQNITFHRATSQGNWQFAEARYRIGSNKTALSDTQEYAVGSRVNYDVYNNSRCSLECYYFGTGDLQLGNHIKSGWEGSYYVSIEFQAQGESGWSDDPMIDDKGSAGGAVDTQRSPRRKLLLKLRPRT